jgi:glycerol-3-phosphate acyltransferase PlsY
LGVLLVAYLLGAIPTGYLVARAVKGIDIREHGSGNTGATNVLRVVGRGAGFSVLVIDLLKGVAAVWLARWVMEWLAMTQPTVSVMIPWWIAIAGLMAVVGHSRSIWLNWTGGKSAATGLGVLMALCWPVGLGTMGVFALVLGVSRLVSLGSITAAIASGLLMVLFAQPLPSILLAIAGGLYVILRHRTNIQRLLNGTEPRLGSRTASESEG